ncbi:hypothetical protein M569_14437, partial [Genlisea aurea]
RGSTIPYMYPQDDAFATGVEDSKNNSEVSETNILIHSGKTPIIALCGDGKFEESRNPEYIYDYTASFTLAEGSHRGLGYSEKMESSVDFIEPVMEIKQKGTVSTELMSLAEGETENTDLGRHFSASTPPANRKQGYVLIGGTKIYTDDISDDAGLESSDGEESFGSSDSEDGSASENDCASDSSSDIDEEIAADYLEGIGGNLLKVINVDSLAREIPDGKSDSESCLDIVHQRFGGISLQQASKEYGMKKYRSGKKYLSKNKEMRENRCPLSSSLDDLILLKDTRHISGKKKSGHKSKRQWSFPGEKKKHRKETMAAKRHDRMIRRGVDLEKINLKLQQLVLDGIDMFSFPPMKPKDCSQVRRLASVYHLQ